MQHLQPLLEDGTRYDPHYFPSMNSDHLPMTLCAMAGLGADRSTCLAQQKEYAKRLRPVRSPISLTQWRDGIGRSDAYSWLLGWFRSEVESKGIAATVAEYLPEFLASLAQKAFHPLIRLSYAIDFDSPAETAAGLAYLVSSHRHTPVDERHDVNLAQRIQAQAVSPRSFTNSIFSKRIDELLDNGDYPTGSASNLEECATVALDAYRHTRNFFALHMVTATHALRVCSELVDPELGRAALTGGLLAAHSAVGSPSIDREHIEAAPTTLDREHVFKYLWTCLAEYRAYGDTRYAEELKAFVANGSAPTWCASNLNQANERHLPVGERPGDPR